MSDPSKDPLKLCVWSERASGGALRKIHAMGIQRGSCREGCVYLPRHPSLYPVGQAPICVCKSIHIARQYLPVLDYLYNTAQYSKMYPKQHHRLTYRFHLPAGGQI